MEMEASRYGGKVMGFRVSPISLRRWQNFKRNRRGYWSLWIFLVLFFATLGAELIANDKPVLVRYDGGFYMPVFKTYPETVDSLLPRQKYDMRRQHCRALRVARQRRRASLYGATSACEGY